MKKEFLKYIGVLVFTMVVSSAFAQTAPPPNGGDYTSGGGTPVGGGAPVGSGVIAMMIFGSAYAVRKLKMEHK